MAQWTHAICVNCWDREHPEKPVPLPRLNTGPIETCCVCKDLTRAGIYIRRDPLLVKYDRGEER